MGTRCTLHGMRDERGRESQGSSSDTAGLGGKAKPGFFYGWAVVGVLVVFTAMVVGLAGANIAIFIEPMTRELGWSPAAFGWAQMARLETVIIAGPVLGRVIDRYGPRVLVAVAGVLTSGLVVSLAYVTEEWQLVAVFVATGLLGMGRAADLFVAAPVSKWFIRKRGLAMGVALAGTPLGVAIFYPLSQFMIDAIGWRDTWVVFGVAGAIVIGPLSLLVLRRQPEDLGLLPDGDAPESVGREGQQNAPVEVSWTRAEAVRHPTFWLLVGGFTLFTYGWSTITIFRVPHYIERGLNPTLVAFAIATDAVVAIVASVLLGRLSDRIKPRYVLVVGVASLLVCAGSLVVVDGVLVLLVANIGYGFGFQTGHVAQNMMWADYYGRRHLGDIRGLSLPLTFGLGAVAFPMTGIIREVTGTYTPAWAAAAVALTLAAVALVAVQPPTKHLE
jgi:MFS family permease